MNLTTQLKEHYPRLSQAQKKIADYILENPESFLNQSAMEIGEKSKTSPATVIRFGKALGYSSLEELKIHIAKDIGTIKQTETLETIFSDEDDVEAFTKKTYELIDASLIMTKSRIKTDPYDKAIAALVGAQSVYLFGVGASGLVATDFYQKLMRANKKTFYNLDTHLSLVSSYHTTPDDIAIGFSYSGETKETILAFEQAKMNHTLTIAITREKESTLAKIADIVLTVPNTEGTTRIAAIASKYSSMFVADILFLGLAQEQFEDAEKGFIETSKLAKKLK